MEPTLKLNEGFEFIDRVIVSWCCMDMTFQSEIAEFAVTIVAARSGGFGRERRRIPFTHNRNASQ